MIDYMTFRVSDIEVTKRFYDAVMPTIGYVPRFDGVHEGGRILGYGKDNKIDTWFIDNTSPVSSCVHIAWSAQTRQQVDDFYRAALTAGGKDNGAPGLRPHYHAHYYGAFVIDPNGHNIEAVCHQPG